MRSGALLGQPVAGSRHLGYMEASQLLPGMRRFSIHLLLSGCV